MKAEDRRSRDIGTSPPAAQEPARLPVAGAGPAADPSPATRSAIRKSATTTPIARTTRSAGSAGRAWSRGRRSHRLHRPPDLDKAPLSANPFAALARRPAGGRYVRRVVADAGRRGHEGSGLEISRKAVFSPTCSARPSPVASRCSSCSMPRPRRSRSRCRSCWKTGPGGTLLNTADAKQEAVGPGVGKRGQGASALGPCLCGFGMNERQFGATLTADGAAFRLWAPAANASTCCSKSRTRCGAVKPAVSPPRSRCKGRRMLQIPDRRRHRRARSRFRVPARERLGSERGDRSR